MGCSTTNQPAVLNWSHRPRSGVYLGKAESGFTLLELLIVLAIIAILAALVAPQYLDRLESSKITATNAQIKMLKASLDTMRLDIGRYPTTQEGLAMLVDPPADPVLRGRWHGPYLDGAVPDDPWGNPYNYAYTGTGNPPLMLYSHGDTTDTSKQHKDIGIKPTE